MAVIRGKSGGKKPLTKDRLGTCLMWEALAEPSMEEKGRGVCDGTKRGTAEELISSR
jgi:hypothetical protein